MHSGYCNTPSLGQSAVSNARATVTSSHLAFFLDVLWQVPHLIGSNTLGQILVGREHFVIQHLQFPCLRMETFLISFLGWIARVPIISHTT